MVFLLSKEKEIIKKSKKIWPLPQFLGNSTDGKFGDIFLSNIRVGNIKRKKALSLQFTLVWKTLLVLFLLDGWTRHASNWNSNQGRWKFPLLVHSSSRNVLIDVSSWLKINGLQIFLEVNWGHNDIFKDSQLSVVIIEIYTGNHFILFLNLCW
jgi:hypothetical protein